MCVVVSSVLKFAGPSVANVRHGSPAFILKLTAKINSSPTFARVRHSSPALLSKCPLYLFMWRVHVASVAKRFPNLLTWRS